MSISPFSCLWMPRQPAPTLTRALQCLHARHCRRNIDDDFRQRLRNARPHVVAIKKLLSGGASDVFNVGTGAGQSVLEVMRAVEQERGQKVPHEIGPRRAGDPAVLVANADKLKRSLGWKPKFVEIKDIMTTAWQFEQKRAAARSCS
jgi:nucleoside-diphosphate-sugar epimerase